MAKMVVDICAAYYWYIDAQKYRLQYEMPSPMLVSLALRE